MKLWVVWCWLLLLVVGCGQAFSEVETDPVGPAAETPQTVDTADSGATDPEQPTSEPASPDPAEGTGDAGERADGTTETPDDAGELIVDTDAVAPFPTEPDAGPAVEPNPEPDAAPADDPTLADCVVVRQSDPAWCLIRALPDGSYAVKIPDGMTAVLKGKFVDLSSAGADSTCRAGSSVSTSIIVRLYDDPNPSWLSIFLYETTNRYLAEDWTERNYSGVSACPYYWDLDVNARCLPCGALSGEKLLCMDGTSSGVCWNEDSALESYPAAIRNPSSY